jgi:CheY-like chemotaxis protein
MQSLNAIVIDDDPMSLRVLSEALLLIGVSCTTVQDPNTLSSILELMNTIDVVFLDLEMPQQDGYSVLRMLKEELEMSIPVIAYTVHTNEMSHARQVGFDGFLGKPLRFSRFSDQFWRILSGEGVWEAD